METVECRHCKTVNEKDYDFCKSCCRPSGRCLPSETLGLPYNWTCKFGHENKSTDKPKAGDRCRGRRTGWKKYFQLAANCHESYKPPVVAEAPPADTDESGRYWWTVDNTPPACVETHDDVDEPSTAEPESKPDNNGLPTYTSFARYETFYENPPI